MATPRQKVQVGVFLSVCGLLLAGTLVVLAGWHRERALPYVIEFDESVSGLVVGSDVTYRGVPVGQVTHIEVAPTNRIRVQIEIRPSSLKVRPGMTAQLGAAGITGQLYVNLAGGKPDSEVLEAGATIPALPSLFTNISTALPTMLSSTNSILFRLEKALSKEGEVSTLFVAAEQLVTRLDATVSEFSARALILVERLDTFTSDDMRPLFEELTATAQTSRVALERLEPVLRETLTSSAQTFERLERHVAALQPEETGVELRTALDHLAQLSDQLARSNQELSLTLQSLRNDVGNAEFHFRQAVRSWRDTLASAKQLFDVLEQNPTSLITGRRAPARARDGSGR